MSTLTFKKLRAISLRRCDVWHPDGIHQWSLSDWGVATCGELGEACNVIKKLNRERDNLTGNSESIVNLRTMLSNEIADTLIYLDLLAARAGIDLETAVVKKFNATSLKHGFKERL